MTEQYWEAKVKIEFYNENGHIYHKLNEILLKNGIKLKFKLNVLGRNIQNIIGILT